MRETVFQTVKNHLFLCFLRSQLQLSIRQTHTNELIIHFYVLQINF